jgi:hypothetical protein
LECNTTYKFYVIVSYADRAVAGPGQEFLTASFLPPATIHPDVLVTADRDTARVM